MSRVRLTARSRSSADQTPYPGNVNQPDRKDPSWEQYHTFEQTVNHELPDMRHQWQDDSRDDIGFGVPEAWGKQPTLASLKVAANKSVRVAVLMLGDKVGDEVIEAQASDFLAMGSAAMDRTIQRFAETQKFYAADEVKVDEKVEEKKAADEKVEVKDEEKKAALEDKFKTDIEKPGSPEQPKVAEEKKDEKVEEKCAAVEEKKDDEKKASDLKALIASAVAEAMKAALPDFIQKKVDEKKEKDEKKAADEKVEDKKSCAAADEVKVDEKVEEKKAADEVKVDEKVEEKDEKKASKVAMGEFDIELTGAMEDEVAPDAEADGLLASLFDDAVTAGTSDRKVEASQKKAGITKLGGQPRVVTASGSGVDISDIWQTAPDVSAAFK